MTDDERWTAAAELTDEAARLVIAGDLQEAEEKATRAFSELTAVLPEGHPDIANALDTLARVALARGDLPLSLERFARALELFAMNSAEEMVQRMRLPTLLQLSYALLQAGDYAKAGALVQEALRESRRIVGMQSIETAEALNLLGVWHKLQGEFSQADAAYAESVAIHRALHPRLPLVLLHNLAGLACARGQPAEAEAILREAIDLRRAEPAESASTDALGLAGDLAGLGDALAGLSRFAEAVAAYREALEILARGGFGEHAEVAYCLHNLGDALAQAGDFSEAERAYLDSIRRKQILFGREHHEVAASLANLAVLLFDTDRADEARPMLQRAILLARSLSASHPVRLGCEQLARRHGLQDSSDPGAKSFSPIGSSRKEN